jgi:hypothetical protein
MITKADLFADLRSRIEAHVAVVTAVFLPLSDEQLTRQPDPKEWNILQCFDHLNLTHAYYRPKIEAALVQPRPAKAQAGLYKPSFWGRIYMHFAFNPKYSFPTVEEMTPETAVTRQTLYLYLQKQTELLQTLDQTGGVDLRRTPIPIAKGVKFNLGDVLKILVYHDELHIGQAEGVLNIR